MYLGSRSLWLASNRATRSALAFIAFGSSKLMIDLPQDRSGPNDAFATKFHLVASNGRWRSVSFWRGAHRLLELIGEEALTRPGHAFLRTGAETTRYIVVQRAVHFVWFRGDEYWSAVSVWGQPDYIHIGWDKRAQRDIAPGDVVIFARGPCTQLPAARSYNDTIERLG